MEDALHLLDGLDVDIPEDATAEGGRSSTALGGNEFFGPYHLIQEVGMGGVARVIRARHIHPRYAETTFALKVLHPDLSRDPHVVGLFRHEAYVLSMLNHPNIVKTFEAGAQDDRLFIAMEYIDGRDLDALRTRCQRTNVAVPLLVASHIVGEILKGLDYAHGLADADGVRLNLVHRDINPANVFLSYDGRVKIGDFGVALIAAGLVERNRQLAGKVGYFAPEQLAGATVDQRADIFAMGVILYELLCGSRLFDAQDTDTVMRMNKKAKIPRPTRINKNIPPGLEQIMLTALERRPADRFQSAQAMLAALRPFLPEPKGMDLAVAALMRKVFLREHVEELQLREGLAGGEIRRGAGQLVAVFSGNEKARLAFSELLASRGYRVDVCRDFVGLQRSMQGEGQPNMVLLDVCCPEFSVQEAVEVLAGSHGFIPVVGYSEALEPAGIRAADAVGAVDFLFKPFNVERVLSAVRLAVSGAVRAKSSSESDAMHDGHWIRPRILIVSSDPELISRLTSALSERGFVADVSPSRTEAFERCHHASYQAVAFDAAQRLEADAGFAAEFRALPGMGLVPIVFLVNGNVEEITSGFDLDRSAVRPREDPVVVLIETINRLRADVRHGRTFFRFDVDLPVEVRFGGRVFRGHTVDLSRGGAMLRVQQMPPVGTSVNIGFRLPGENTPVEVRGIVVRVELPTKSGQQLPGIGVEFDRFSGRGESKIIEIVERLHSKSSRVGAAALSNAPKR